jgi:RNA polymerase primary sigma factor
VNTSDELRYAIENLTEGLSGLRQLFWLLGYNYADAPVPVPPNSPFTSVLSTYPRLIAKGCYQDFVVVWFPLHELDKQTEDHIHSYYSHIYPYALYVFSNQSQDIWHFTCIPQEHEPDTIYTITVRPASLSHHIVQRVASLAIDEDAVDNILDIYEQIIEACTTKQVNSASGRRIKKESLYWKDSIGWWLEKFSKYPLLNAEEEARLAGLAAAGDESARNRLVLANLRLVLPIAKKYARPELPLPDLLQEGHIGLLTAVEKYDVKRGYRFSTYATWWIRRAVTRAVANKARLIRLPVYIREKLYAIQQTAHLLEQRTGELPSADAIAIEAKMPVQWVKLILPLQQDVFSLESLGKRAEMEARPIFGSTILDVESEIMASALRKEIDCLLEILTSSQCEVIRSRFGLDDNPEQTLEQIGSRLGVSRERVRQIEEAAIKRMIKHSSRLQNFLTEELQKDTMQAAFPKSMRAKKQSAITGWPNRAVVRVVWPNAAPKTQPPAVTIQEEPSLHSSDIQEL